MINPNQEKIEEAAERYENKDQHQRSGLDFIEGAKWMQQRMYSEEEVISLLQKYRYDLSSGKTPNLGDNTGVWFEQFKKK